ncbi:uncharacterized protein LOC133028234 isoform X2 [Limanda limanda]|uniref:uncharacterized protein LOC133028234 isoform X2 n=1 Tax=Limanda limanda TaxID=27771 RepID=UPI0029C6D824|nr:uncharacterized protein LOC133028234 isoform X2 [Limanda limanda]
MDFKTVVTISALLLITAEVQTAVAEQGTNAQPKGNSSDAVNLSSAAPATDAVPISDPSSSSPVLFVLTVKWTSKCEGHLILHHPSSPSHVCHYSSTTIRSHLTNVCENKKGCKEPMDLKKGEEMPNGYNISEDRPEMTSCEALMVQCKVSNRSQTRWVGPTQSHSVSHHRGKTCNNEDGEKRLSYPALERLAVSDSREPSSNRSSGYNF